MSWLRTGWAELVGLFVDDGRFAALIVGWLVLCALALRRLMLPTGVAPAVLFAGLAVILVGSAIGRAVGHAVGRARGDRR